MVFKNSNYTKHCALAGAHFVTAPLSFVWNFGNLSAYMESYFKFHCGPGCVDGDSQWIITLFIATGCPGLILSGPVIRKLGVRCAGLLAMLVCNGTFLASAWTVQVSVIGTAVIMGLLNGLGAGITVCVGYAYVNAWAKTHNGVFIATVSSAPTLLSIAQNQIITAYVNPQNLKADARDGPKAYFSQPEILTRVPEVIVIMGIITLSLQIVGYLLVSMPPPNLTSISDTYELKSNQSDQGLGLKKQNDAHAHNSSNVETAFASDSNAFKAVLDGNNHLNYESTVSFEDTSDVAHPKHSQEAMPENSQTAFSSNDMYEKKQDERGDKNHSHLSYKPKDVLQTRSFKVFWLYNLALIYGLILKNNYYKQFGLLYIHNDRLLTLVGSLIPVIATVVRVSFGNFLDRGVLTVKDCVCFSLSINSVLCAFWFFVPQVSSIGYIFLILGLASVHSLSYTMAASGTLIMYGPEHFFSNLTLIYSSSCISSILVALCVTRVLEAVGWFWLFASCSTLSLLALALAVVTDFPASKSS